MAGGIERRATGILSYFTRHGTAANLVLVIMLALGFVALPKMRAQYFPDVIIDSVSVSVSWDGAGAEDVDTAIVQVLEPALLAVEGVTATSASSSEGRASISLEFEPGWDMERAATDVEDAVDAVSNLPEGADDPSVRSGGWSDRVTDVIINGPVGVDQLARFADELVTRLFAEGVTRTSIAGIAAPETVVEVETIALIRHDLSMSEIASAIASQVDTDPAGDVGGGTARVRTGVAKRSAEDIAAIVLRSEADGSKLTIGDVATITVGSVDRDTAYFVGGNSAIRVQVNRSAAGDAIRIQHQVEEVAAALEPTLPTGVKVDLIRTRAEAITNRLELLLSNGAMGLALVVGLLFLFLNARTAIWVAAGIPVAMTAAIAVMYAAGLTFNMISLFALIITLGIVVDDAIVVGEHADFRARRLGEDPVTASENAARRMFAPVFSSTITTVIAFFGLILIGGRFGDLIADIPFTVIAVLMASLAECFLILPNHMSHSVGTGGRWYDWPSRQVNKGFSWFRRVIFRRLMAGVVWARYPVLAFAFLLMVSQVTQVMTGDLQWRFFNAPEQPSISGNFAMAPTATRADTLDMMRELQRATEAVAAKYEAEHGTNPVTYVLAQIGGTSGRGLAGTDNKESYQLGSISIELIDPDARPYSSFAFLSDLQQAVVNHPLAETVSFRGWRSGPGGDALDIELYGAEAQTLKAAAEALKTSLSQFAEVSALEDTLSYDKDELVLELTPQGEALGFSIDSLGSVLRNRLNGIEAATYPDGTRSAKIIVQLPEDELTSDFLDRTHMRTAAGDYVNLADIVSVTTRSGFSTVRRENGIRLVNVTGDLSDDDPARATAIMEQLQDQILPDIEERFGVSSVLSGLSEQEDEFLSDALFGFGACIIGIYLTLAWIFSSWTRPLVVMAVIPFGLVGAFYGHMLWEVPLSMFSVVGLIGMAGIIINDSIVLVGTVDEYAAERGLIPAIIDGAADRLRPVFLTTATTVLGLAPLLYETSTDAQFLKPTVITLVYGLGFGLVLVLLVVPSLLAIQHDVARQFAALRKALRLPARARGMTGLITGAFALMLGLFAGTMGYTAVTGQLLAVLPHAADALPMRAAFETFLILTVGLLIATYLLGAAIYGAGRVKAAKG